MIQAKIVGVVCYVIEKPSHTTLLVFVVSGEGSFIPPRRKEPRAGHCVTIAITSFHNHAREIEVGAVVTTKGFLEIGDKWDEMAGVARAQYSIFNPDRIEVLSHSLPMTHTQWKDLSR